MTAETKHDCVAKLNELLKPYNTRLMDTISLGSDDKERILLATCKVHPKARSNAVQVFATYCPMCGVEL
jgi:hypothetical protein